MNLYAAADLGSNSARLLLARAVNSSEHSEPESLKCRGRACLCPEIGQAQGLPLQRLHTEHRAKTSETANGGVKWERVLSMRFVTRLGETPGTLSSGGVERTVNAVGEFLKALSPYGDMPFSLKQAVFQSSLTK